VTVWWRADLRTSSSIDLVSGSSSMIRIRAMVRVSNPEDGMSTQVKNAEWPWRPPFGVKGFNRRQQRAEERAAGPLGFVAESLPWRRGLLLSGMGRSVSHK
jgi:hypothetical protein